MKYDVFFFDHGANIYSSQRIEAADDIEARKKARAISASGIGMGYEIRCGETHIHTELYGERDHERDGAVYMLYFVDAANWVVTVQDIVARSDEEACEIAAVLFDACCDSCADYEVWSADARLKPARSKAPAPRFHFLGEYAQSVVMAREIALRDGRTAIAESKRLLARLAELQVG